MSLRWGVLGAGSVAQRRVMPAILANSECELSALMVRDGERAETLAAEFGAARSYTHVASLLDDPEVDAVYVSSPPHLHCEHVVAAAKRGKHVLCEKPMALQVDECRKMIDACERAGVHLEVCFVLRGWPVHQQVKEIVASGGLGQVVEVRAHLAKWTPRKEDEWRLDPAQGGGGALMDVGAHYLDLFRYLLGDFRRISCLASSKVFGYPVEESAFATVEFVSGVHGVLATSYSIPFSGNILEIYGTKGTLFMGKELKVVTAEGETVEAVVFPDYYSGLLDHFCGSVASGGPAIASGMDGLKCLEAVLAGYRSVREARVVEMAS
ncbi:MAG: Gfo/Idh/MocA family oxidoreductase [bacterium]|nr:Gfo/Idh/MocA family oxidoreductase [bacterium]